MTASDLPEPAGVILAGGRSRRMDGRDKAFCAIGGQSLAARCTARLRPQVGELALNANADPARFADLRMPVLPDSIPNYPGPLGGILAALEWAHGRHDAVATVAVDTPFFPETLVARLARERRDGSVAVAASGGRLHPVFALWPCGLRDDLRRFLAAGTTGRVTAFLEGVGFTAVEFAPVLLASGSFDPFFNINTPDDLALAQSLAAEFEA